MSKGIVFNFFIIFFILKKNLKTSILYPVLFLIILFEAIRASKMGTVKHYVRGYSSDAYTPDKAPYLEYLKNEKHFHRTVVLHSHAVEKALDTASMDYYS